MKPNHGGLRAASTTALCLLGFAALIVMVVLGIVMIMVWEGNSC